MNKTRRNFLQSAALLSAGALARKRHPSRAAINNREAAAAKRNTRRKFLPVMTPDVPDLPFQLDNGVKVFHLVAEPVKQEIYPGKILNLWGYNGSAPGPTIQVNQGDRVRIIVDNHLPEPTSMHWHGFEFPSRWTAVPASRKTRSPRRPLRLRIHAAAGRHLLLPLAHGHAGNDGHDRRVHHAPAGALRPARGPGLRHHPAGIRRAAQ